MARDSLTLSGDNKIITALDYPEFLEVQNNVQGHILVQASQQVVET
jgi:hypothetical protein